MPKQKVGKGYDKLKAFYPEFRPVIVFGTQRIGAIFALRNGIAADRIKLALAGADSLKGISGGDITVVRVAPEVWSPSTNPCAQRTKETEQALKALEKTGTIINTVRLA